MNDTDKRNPFGKLIGDMWVEGIVNKTTCPEMSRQLLNHSIIVELDHPLFVPFEGDTIRVGLRRWKVK
jgi:hypothetical protein